MRLDAVAERPGTCRAIIECVPSNHFSPSYHSTYARLAQGIAATLGRAVAEVVEQQRQEAARAQLQAQLDRARLGLLQAQVQPHFLYNTLATLKLLIRSDGAAAERMTADLIRFLQLSLPNARAEDSTLARELDIVEAYLDIMKIRMGPRLQVRFARPEGAERINVPPLVIHTLVENAIKHGLEPKPAGGRIDVTAERTAHGTLRIAVADDGAGLRLESRGTGVGLTNLRERLALLYGDRASFSIAPREPSWPGVSGLEVARAAGGRAHVVFVTAFSQLAVQAFENEAADFLVKPVTEERLRLTIERLKRRLAAPPRSLEAILRKIESTFEHPKREPLRWITASQGKQTRLVMIDEVVYFQSDHKYTRVVTAEEELLIRTPIRQLGEELDPARFRQVHRSTIVNLACVRALEREDARAVLRLKNRDETLVVSEAYLPLFRQM